MLLSVIGEHACYDNFLRQLKKGVMNFQRLDVVLVDMVWCVILVIGGMVGPDDHGGFFKL